MALTLEQLLAQRRAQGQVAPSRPVSNYTLEQRLGRTNIALPESEIIDEFQRAPVTETADLDRILALPRRPRPSTVELEQYAAKWTRQLSNGVQVGQCACESDFADRAVPCINSLNPLQGWACEEFYTERGLLGKLAVGAGKTGLDVLLAMVRNDTRVALLLLQPTLMRQFVLQDFPQWAAHFKVPNLVVPRMLGEYPEVRVMGRPTLYVYTYADLQQPKNTALLPQLAPDLIIADESQNLARVSSSRTIRFMRYCEAHPECAFVALSGSMHTRSLNDFAHHAALALRKNSPLPLDNSVVLKWAKALDPAPEDGIPTPIGKLRVFCTPGEDAVQGVGRRLIETRGVVASEESSTDVPLYINEREAPEIPEKLLLMMQDTRATATRPDGEEAETSFQKAAWLKQLACGFYYYWKFIRGEPEELVEKWFGRRKNWNKEVRMFLDAKPPEHLDSPRLLKLAAERFRKNYRGPLPTWNSYSYEAWSEVEHLVDPVQGLAWLDDYLVDDAVRWAEERKAEGVGGLIWCEFVEFGQRVAKRLGVDYLNGGPDAAKALASMRGNEIVVLSIRAHQRGCNLQMFRRALVVSNPADDGTWEQLLGRMHRYGQKHAVTVDLYRHTPELREALEKARERSEWNQKLDRSKRKLMLARCSWVRKAM